MTSAAQALAPLVHKLQRLGDLSEQDVAAIHTLPHSLRSARHFTVLIREGQASGHCTLIVSGIAARDRTTRAGARQFVGFHIKGDLVDLNSGLIGHAHDTVQVLGGAEVDSIPLGAIVALALDRSTIGRLLWTDTLLDASIAREWPLSVGRRDARTRLLHFLCEPATRQEQGIGTRDKLDLPLTQEQLGDVLGLTAVHVNRVLQSLKNKPAIERIGRTIRIKDWGSLVCMADFNDAYLQVKRRPYSDRRTGAEPIVRQSNLSLPLLNSVRRIAQILRTTAGNVHGSLIRRR